MKRTKTFLLFQIFLFLTTRYSGSLYLYTNMCIFYIVFEKCTGHFLHFWFFQVWITKITHTCTHRGLSSAVCVRVVRSMRRFSEVAVCPPSSAHFWRLDRVTRDQSRPLPLSVSKNLCPSPAHIPSLTLDPLNPRNTFWIRAVWLWKVVHTHHSQPASGGLSSSVTLIRWSDHWFVCVFWVTRLRKEKIPHSREQHWPASGFCNNWRQVCMLERPANPFVGELHPGPAKPSSSKE